MAAEQDAARDRVLAARAALDEELTELRGSARAAVDIPSKVRQSPAKAAAVAGGIAFLVLRGPQRLWRALREKVTGRPAPMPSRLLPKEIEKTLDKMGEDGDKVRGTLERDFAAYVKEKQKDRRGMASIVLLGLLRPVIGRAARRAGEFLMSPSPEGYSTRLEEIRARAGATADDARASAERAAERAADRAKGTVDQARGSVERARSDAARTPEEPPAGV